MFPRPNVLPATLDLSICSPSFAPRCHWSVIDEPFGSNHLGILITIDKHHLITPGPSTSRKWKIEVADWERYALLADDLLKDFVFTPDIPANYNNFLNILNLAEEKSIPKIRPYLGNKPRRPPKPWWDTECDTARKNNLDMYKIYKNSPNESNFIRSLRFTSQCRKLYKLERKEKWEEFCNSFSISTPVKEIWSKVRALRHGYQGAVPTNEEWIPEFLNSLTPVTVPEDCNYLQTSPSDLHPLEEPFRASELSKALKTNSNTTPGVDNIHYPMLHHLSRFGKTILLKIYNSIWMNQIHIEQWSEQIVVPLLKPHKDPNLYHSYRPIALSSCLGKTFERLIKQRLEWWVESERLLPACQNGFRKKRSTIDALSNFITDVHDTFADKKFMLAVNIDLENAFNNVNITILMRRLISLGTPIRIVRNIHNLLASRSIVVRSNGKLYGPRQTHTGLPQGAVLSPILFNIYTAALAHVVSPEISISLFADDVIIYIARKVLEEAVAILDVAMSAFSHWCFDMGFTISQNKSSVTLFTRKRNFTLSSAISLGSYNLKVVPVMKSLGMYIDGKALWKTHIEYVVKKCEQVLNVLRCINHLNYGADVKTSLKLYKQLVLSQLDYGCFLYGDAANTHLLKLDRVQYKALKSCLGALTSTPTNALLAEAKEAPLDIRRKLLASRFLVDRYCIKANTLIPKIGRISPKILKFWQKKKLPILVEQYRELMKFTSPITRGELIPACNFDFFLPDNVFHHILTEFYYYNDKLSSSANNACFLSKLHSKFPNFSFLYTDGSKYMDRVGCAIYDPLNKVNYKFRLPSVASVFAAELAAIRKSLDIVKLIKGNYIILSDCKSVLSQLRVPGDNASFAIWETIHSIHSILRSGNQVYLMWVKGHVGLKGNEMADNSAKLATELPKPTMFFILPSDLKNAAKLNSFAKWNKIYHLSKNQKGSFYTALQPAIPVKPWFHHYTETRRFYTTLSRLRFNHNFSPQHLSKIGISIQPQCSCDLDRPPDSTHIILSCDKFTEGREQLLDAVAATDCPRPFNLHTILAHHNNNVYLALYHFIQINNITL